MQQSEFRNEVFTDFSKDENARAYARGALGKFQASSVTRIRW